MPKYDDAEIQDVKYDAAIYRGNVEWAQRGLPHRHILPYHVIQELRAAAELRARQHAESVMRPTWTRVCATHRWRRTVAQRHKVRWWTCKRLTQYSKSNSNSNSTNSGMISRGLPVAGSVQVLRPISALSLAKIIWPEYWDSKRHWRLFWTNARNTGCRNTMMPKYRM